MNAHTKLVLITNFSCPVDEMSEIIDPLANVNEEVYFSKFKTFRFGNQSTVFAHCTVQVCLTTEECAQVLIATFYNENDIYIFFKVSFKNDQFF